MKTILGFVADLIARIILAFYAVIDFFTFG